MEENFTDSLARVLAHEGGYVDHPEDPGGATNKGITLETFRSYFGAYLTSDDLRDITDYQVEYIYNEGYWDKCSCDDLPAGIDYVVFDQAVNSGPSRSVMWLQETLDVAADGIIGPITLDKVSIYPAPGTINAMCDIRLEFLCTLSTWPTFGEGWESRVKDVRAHALKLAQLPAAPEPQPADETYQAGHKAGIEQERARAVRIIKAHSAAIEYELHQRI